MHLKLNQKTVCPHDLTIKVSHYTKAKSKSTLETGTWVSVSARPARLQFLWGEGKQEKSHWQAFLCRVAYLTTCNFTQIPKNWNSSLLYYFQLKIKPGSGTSEHMQEALSVDKVLG